MRSFTPEEVAKHHTSDDLTIWSSICLSLRICIPGAAILVDEEIAGKDATEAFYALHRQEVLGRPQYVRLQVGVVEGKTAEILPRLAGDLSKVPYSEPAWLSEGYFSPYFTEKHRDFQKVVRKFVDEIIIPDALGREADGKPPSTSVIEEMAKVNLIAMRMGPGKHLKGRELLGGIVKPEEFDYFHMIINQELTRAGQRGYADGLIAGSVIGLPPVMNYGSEEIKAKVIPEVLSGKKLICLAISEAFAGSDVTDLQTRAELSQDGKEWLINGTKKWITNGTFAHYFTVGCKTDKGFTVILVERGPGVETRQIKTSYSTTAGTAFVSLDNVRVSVENTLGKVGSGVFVMLSNFNHERLVMATASVAFQRLVVEECFKWISQRKAFRKPLHAVATIRGKMWLMVSRVECVQAWLEGIIFNMNSMSYKTQADKLAGPIAMLKMTATRTAQETATDAVQIFGGRGITQTGQGALIEHYHRTVTFDSILGGAEDVLGDLGIRQAIRNMPANARL